MNVNVSENVLQEPNVGYKTFKNQCVMLLEGRIILKRIFEKVDGGIDWIDLALDRDRWWAVVNAVMNLRAP
jgi:hypothetical protein